MGVIAVAGGTGGLGRAIVDSILARGNHEVLVLSRKIDVAKEQEVGARFIAADYSNVASLVSMLEENKIDTVISTIDMQQSLEPDLNLTQAAERSSVTKRLIPSMWGTKYDERIESMFSAGKGKMTLLRAVAKTNLEYTAIYIGYFLDYYVAPHVKSYMNGRPLFLDIPNNASATPGSGNTPVGLSYSIDVGNFVAALIDETNWEKENFIIPDKVTWNEFVKIAEEAKGVKFSVQHDSIEDLKAGKMSELPGYEKVFYPTLPKEKFGSVLSIYGILFESGALDLKPAHSLNERYPDIKVHTVKELVTKAWEGKK
ncbi:hypothetical protein FE257_005724 [Aspergillus nanangensis]|uniref:NmrA-like domain-containing protein n=1 Tax=Aspergillus nanangensis TaxID=2582783 RepID=A0AAD4GWK1_ASPNN|nr:hypothetical protein FE257_005724 [Aspergillus nanangensis]